MLAQLRSSLTYSNVMATVAVFVALGGTSYALATGSIDSREIKNNTVRSKDIRNNNVTTRDLQNSSARGADVRDNSLTGADVLESSLGTVPSASSANTADSANTANTAVSAQSAATATSAGSLNGLRVLPIKHRSGADVTNVTIFDAGGLQLSMPDCMGGDEEVRASTTVADGEISVVSDDADVVDASADGISHQFDSDFMPGDVIDITEPIPAVDNRVYQLHYSGGDGRVVSANLATESNIGADNCVVSGYAVVIG